MTIEFDSGQLLQWNNTSLHLLKKSYFPMLILNFSCYSNQHTGRGKTNKQTNQKKKKKTKLSFFEGLKSNAAETDCMTINERQSEFHICLAIVPLHCLPHPRDQVISDPVLNFRVNFNRHPSFSHFLGPFFWAQRPHHQLPCSSTQVWVAGPQDPSSKCSSPASSMQRPEDQVYRTPSLNV